MAADRWESFPLWPGLAMETGLAGLGLETGGTPAWDSQGSPRLNEKIRKHPGTLGIDSRAKTKCKCIPANDFPGRKTFSIAEITNGMKSSKQKTKPNCVLAKLFPRWKTFSIAELTNGKSSARQKNKTRLRSCQQLSTMGNVFHCGNHQ